MSTSDDKARATQWSYIYATALQGACAMAAAGRDLNTGFTSHNPQEWALRVANQAIERWAEIYHSVPPEKPAPVSPRDLPDDIPF